MTQDQSEKSNRGDLRARGDYESILSRYSHSLITTFVNSGRYDDLYKELEAVGGRNTSSSDLATDFETRMFRDDRTTDVILCMYGSPGMLYPGEAPGPISEFNSARRHYYAEVSLDFISTDDEYWITAEAEGRLEYIYERNPNVYYELLRRLIDRHPNVEQEDRAAHAALIAAEVNRHLLEDLEFWISDEGMDLLDAVDLVTPALHSEIVSPLYERVQFLGTDIVGADRLNRTVRDALEQRGPVFERYYARFEEVLYARYVDQEDAAGLIDLLDRYREQGEGTHLEMLCDEFETRLLRTRDGNIVLRHLLDLSQDLPPEIEQPSEPKPDPDDPFKRMPKAEKAREPGKKEQSKRDEQEASANVARARLDQMLNLIVDDQVTFEYPDDCQPRLERLRGEDEEIFFEVMRTAARRVSDLTLIEPDRIATVGSLFTYVLPALRTYGENVERIGPHYEYWGSTDGMEVLSDMYFRDRELYLAMLRNLSSFCRRTPSPKYGYAQYFDCQIAIYREFEEDRPPEHFHLSRLPAMGEVIADRMHWMSEPEPPIEEDGVGNTAWFRWFNDRAVLFIDKTDMHRTLADTLSGYPITYAAASKDLDVVVDDHREKHFSPRERQLLRHVGKYGTLYFGRVSKVMADRVEAAALLPSDEAAATQSVVACVVGILEHSHMMQADEDASATFETAENVMELSTSQKTQLKRIEKILAKLPRWNYVVTGDKSAKYTHNALGFFRTFETRGLNVRVRITPKGLMLHNPMHTQGKVVVKGRDGGKTMREHEGGDDFTIVKWKDIADANIDIDFSPIADLAMGIVSGAMMVSDGRIGEPSMEALMHRGPGTIKFDMKGRETPLLELPPVKYPSVFAELIQELARIFAHSPRDGMALLAYLSGAESD